MCNERHTTLQQITDARIIAARACQQNSIDPMVFDQMAIRVHLRLAWRRTHQHQIEAVTRQQRSDGA
jgi:hypothetical protein